MIASSAVRKRKPQRASWSLSFTLPGNYRELPGNYRISCHLLWEVVYRALPSPNYRAVTCGNRYRAYRRVYIRSSVRPVRKHQYPSRRGRRDCPWTRRPPLLCSVRRMDMVDDARSRTSRSDEECPSGKTKGLMSMTDSDRHIASVWLDYRVEKYTEATEDE